MSDVSAEYVELQDFETGTHSLDGIKDDIRNLTDKILAEHFDRLLRKVCKLSDEEIEHLKKGWVHPERMYNWLRQKHGQDPNFIVRNLLPCLKPATIRRIEESNGISDDLLQDSLYEVIDRVRPVERARFCSERGVTQEPTVLDSFRDDPITESWRHDVICWFIENNVGDEQNALNQVYRNIEEFLKKNPKLMKKERKKVYTDLLVMNSEIRNLTVLSRDHSA